MKSKLEWTLDIAACSLCGYAICQSKNSTTKQAYLGQQVALCPQFFAAV